MAKVQIKAKTDCTDSLRPIARMVRSYFEANPIAEGIELSCEIVQCKLSAEEFTYEWNMDVVNPIVKSAWQASFDVWMRRHFGGKLPLGVSGLKVRFFDADSFGSNLRGGQESGRTGMLAGTGLVEFKSAQPRYRLEDLIVDDGVMRAILSAVAIIRHSNLIYRDWGFESVDPLRRTVLNFYGPAGMGKTMAAHGVAQSLGKRILIANFAEIESRYVGDSPKNLENLFRRAAIDDAVLFFDEADSFLGSRITNISSSSDQAVNSLRSKLLQLLEDHSGVVIFCTNFLKNYDKAFESRILSNIRFEYPDLSCRKRLIRQKIPERVPFRAGESLDNESLTVLADICNGLSGREIKNAVLRTLCDAAVKGIREFYVEDFAEGFRRVQIENSKVQQERGELTKRQKNDLASKVRSCLDRGEYSRINRKAQEVANVEPTDSCPR